ncbi:unnamed protein product [Nyctereutes procyonoides]|uniref:(raccoon dog) hypothetical protein n=1 Tax=Nyctereutes procyonoides TaxID=34880 RepID=A0A811ZIJ1_NYCPR|nr:unnamed protein product [Nyctereutes procyonoides]
MATPAWPGGQEAGAGPHGREAVLGTGPRLCRPKGWPMPRKWWKRERGMTSSPRSGPVGRLDWQIPRIPLAFLLDKSESNPPPLWPWASHTTLMSLFPHLQNGDNNSSHRIVAKIIVRALGACQDGKPGGKRMTQSTRAVADSQPSPARGLGLGQQHQNNTLPKQLAPPRRSSLPNPLHFTALASIPCPRHHFCGLSCTPLAMGMTESRMA